MTALATARPPRRADPHDPANRKRLDILDAAIDVFARDGFAAATVDAIASSAGVAKGTVYLYFRSKDELYGAALVRGGAELAALVTRQLAAATSLRAKIEAFVRVRLEYFEAHREFFRVYVAEFTNVFSRALRLSPELDRVYFEQARALEAELTAFVTQGGALSASPADVAFAVADLSRGTAVRRASGQTTNSLEADIEITTRLAWKGLRER
jgi:AcrR family transcriptional regulator